MSPQQRLSFIEQHLELGISTVDHAAIYGSPSCETLFGEALALMPSVRDKLQIVSKCGITLLPPGGTKVSHYNASRNEIIRSAEASLTRLGIEQLDVLLLHRPDYLLDADEVAQAFDELKQSGKVAHFGVSNFTPSQFSLLQSRLDSPLITNQLEINPLNMQVLDSGGLEQLQELRVKPMAWSCLAGGEVFNASTPQALRVRQTLSQLADELGADNLEQVIFAWVMRLPCSPHPILGSGKIDRVKSALGALALSMSHEQWCRLWIASKGHGLP